MVIGGRRPVVQDVDEIPYAKFQIEMYRGYEFTGGGRTFDFFIDFCMGL